MFGSLKQKAADNKVIPRDLLLGLPMTTIIGNAEMTVENFKGIVEYNDDVIRINTGSGILRIEGKTLVLKQVTSETINVTGVIKRVEFA